MLHDIWYSPWSYSSNDTTERVFVKQGMQDGRCGTKETPDTKDTNLHVPIYLFVLEKK